MGRASAAAAAHLGPSGADRPADGLGPSAPEPAPAGHAGRACRASELGATRATGTAGPVVELIARGKKRRRRPGLPAVWALVISLALLVAVPGVASAIEVTRGQLSGLAEQARSDPAALDQLVRVDRVDGRPYPVRDALAGAKGDELDRRLAAIAALAPQEGAPRDSGGARGEAGDILHSNKYEGSDLPRPFKGALDEIGGRLDPVRDWIDEAYEDVVAFTPGGDLTVLVLVAAILLVLLMTLGSRMLRTRARAGAEAREAVARPERETPASLERAAEGAERDGDLEAALRLRFRAGLLRLDARDAIAFRPSISTREVSRALNSPEFDQLVALFEGVAYGGLPASADDLAASRRGWDTVLKKAARP